VKAIAASDEGEKAKGAECFERVLENEAFNQVLLHSQDPWDIQIQSSPFPVVSYAVILFTGETVLIYPENLFLLLNL
jgi:hypothetical protein